MSAVIFDLDGTLIDSAPDSHAAVNRVMEAAGEPDFDLAQVRSFIGDGIAVLIERVMEARGIAPARHEDFLTQFRAFYAADLTTLTTFYPGVPAALQALMDLGFKLAVCTNKPEEPTRRILAEMAISDRFGAVVGGDTLPQRKPDPAPLLHCMSLLEETNCIYVGDSEVDAATAERASVPFILFTEGYRKSPIESIHHSASFDDFGDLIGIIERSSK